MLGSATRAMLSSSAHSKIMVAERVCPWGHFSPFFVGEGHEKQNILDIVASENSQGGRCQKPPSKDRAAAYLENTALALVEPFKFFAKHYLLCPVILDLKRTPKEAHLG